MPFSLFRKKQALLSLLYSKTCSNYNLFRVNLSGRSAGQQKNTDLFSVLSNSERGT